MTTARVYILFKVLFQDFDIGSERTQKTIALSLATIMTASLLAMVAWRVLGALSTDKVVARDYLYMPFDVYDAEQLCEDKMKAKLGSRLLRSYVDERSTRLDEEKSVYRVYLKADVGQMDAYDQVNVYCYIDKWDYDLTYYREVNASAKAALYGDIKFF
ncbi:MAG: hypothetical protein COA42_16290 [Alteromonadaceae bacterium]|nr:MAG: hypothetical protein COA42_16290 [Alteromonadaceae bacterium]